MGTSQRGDVDTGKEGRMKPGPGNYGLISDFRKTAPQYAFGRMERPDAARMSNTVTPGPGAYTAR